MNYSTIEQELKEHGYLCMTPKGQSMWPMLRSGRDSVYLETVNGCLGRDEVALFRSVSGKYILHRVIDVQEGYYTFRGDNAVDEDGEVAQSQILGVLKKFYRGKRCISCDNRKYRIYVAVWNGIYPIRCRAMRCRHKINRLVKKMMGIHR